MKQPFIFSVVVAAWFGAAPAGAQHIAADLLPPYEVSTIVASMGMRPLDRPVWRDGRYVVNAIDRYGRDVRVVLDARDGRVLAVRPRARDYVYEPRYAPPPPVYRRPAPYDPRFDDAPPAPPAAIPGAPMYEDDDEFFDDDRRHSALTPPRAAPNEPAVTNSVPRRPVVTAPARSQDAAKESAKDRTPMPRPRPALARANDPQARDVQPSRAEPQKAPGEKPDADAGREGQSGEKPDAKAAQAQGAKPDAKPDIRVIDLSKKPVAKPEEKPGEAIRF